jgi:hypothetical protein
MPSPEEPTMNRPIFTIGAVISLLLCFAVIAIDISSHSIGQRWIDEDTAGVKSSAASEAGMFVYWTTRIGPRAADHRWHQQTPNPWPPPIDGFRAAGAEVWAIQYWVLIMATAMLPALWFITLDWTWWKTKLHLPRPRTA